MFSFEQTETHDVFPSWVYLTQSWMGVAFVSCFIEWSHYMFIFVQCDFESEIHKIQNWEMSVKDQGKARDLRNQDERHKHQHPLCASQLLILPWEQRERLPLGWKQISGKELDWSSLTAYASPLGLAWPGHHDLQLAGAQARLSALESWCLLPGGKSQKATPLGACNSWSELDLQIKMRRLWSRWPTSGHLWALRGGVFPWVWQDSARLLAGTGRPSSWIL